MQIRPTEDWYWYFDEKLDALMIDLSHEMVFRSHLTKKMIVVDALDEEDFSVQDAALYYHFFESCEPLELSEPNKVGLILNALAARKYLKPLMPKSWYFEQQACFIVPKIGDLALATLQGKEETIQLLVVDSSNSAALCVIAQTRAFMAEKTFYLGEAIKVMHNRLIPPTLLNSDETIDDKGFEYSFLNNVC